MAPVDDSAGSSDEYFDEEAGPADSGEGDAAARNFTVISAVFLGLGLLEGVFLLAKLVRPGILAQPAFFSYGRLAPVFIDTLVYGWLSMGLMGAACYVVPRLTGAPLFAGKLAQLNSLLWAAGTAAGVCAVAIGQSTGREMLEFPLPVVGVLILSSVITAANVLGSIFKRTEAKLYPSLYYLGAAAIWLPMLLATGSAPIYKGVAQSLQSGFFVQGMIGLWLLAGGIGVVLYLLPRVSGNPLYSRRLAGVGFWSLAVTSVWTGPVQLVLGPVPDWLQSIAIVFAMALVIPLWTTLANISGSMRGRWGLMGKSAPIRFVTAGAVALFVLSVMVPVAALRSTSQVLGLTDFGTGNFELLVFGVAGLWLSAFAYFALPLITGRKWSGLTLRNWHLGLNSVGLLALVVGAWVGGTVTGYLWLTGTSNGLLVTSGDGWYAVAWPARAFAMLRVAGMLALVTGSACYLWSLARTVVGGEPGVVEEVDFTAGGGSELPAEEAAAATA